MAENSEILDGLDEIRAFWDPRMSEYKFRQEVLPLLLNTCLFTRNYCNSSRSTKNIPKYYTYKNLVLAVKVKQLNKK